jgi:hypothetical protein
LQDWGYDDSDGREHAPRLVRAAEYVRMSTEHQRYSTENQSDAIYQYAARRGLEVVRTYADEGKSGLRLDGRDALKRLIDDVQTGKADFSTILVYDVSRWGRFQDADESAYYEYICRRAGIAVQYCAEQFENDGSPVSTIVKGVKRAMAGRVQSRAVRKGVRRSMPPNREGLPARRSCRIWPAPNARRSEWRTPRASFHRGEHKSIQTDRVILVPGALVEIETVQWMYRHSSRTGNLSSEIADLLNSREVETEDGRSWTRGRVHQVLTNPKYVGDNVWNRISYKLKKMRVRNDPDMWVRSNGAFEPIVERHLFDAAQALIGARSFRLSDAEMIGALRSVYESKGLLSGIIIDECEGLPSSSAYAQGHKLFDEGVRHATPHVAHASDQGCGPDDRAEQLFADLRTRALSGHTGRSADSVSEKGAQKRSGRPDQSADFPDGA